jgi:transcription initiation factor TFIID subunit 1
MNLSVPHGANSSSNVIQEFYKRKRQSSTQSEDSAIEAHRTTQHSTQPPITMGDASPLDNILPCTLANDGSNAAFSANASESVLPVVFEDWEDDVMWTGEDADVAEATNGTTSRNNRNNRNNHKHTTSTSTSSSTSTTTASTHTTSTHTTSLLQGIPAVPRPGFFHNSAAYTSRLTREENTKLSQAALASVTNKHTAKNSDELAVINAQRRKASEQMKTKRIMAVMKGMGLGGAGMKITSSLMGVGGQDRDAGKIEKMKQKNENKGNLGFESIDSGLVTNNHTFIKPDLSRAERRLFHRPRLHSSMAGTGKRWMMVRTPSNHLSRKQDNNGDDTNNINADGSLLVGGGIEDAETGIEITKESDLDIFPVQTGTTLLAVEYCEEKPPLILNKGMSSKIVNYYKGDRAKCPVSAGGGDVPNAVTSKNSKSALHRTTSVIGLETDLQSNNMDYFVGPDDVKDVEKNFKRQQNAEVELEERRRSSKNNSKPDSNPSSSPEDPVLPHGATQVLDPAHHGPFVGKMDVNTTQSTLVNNCFIAPVFLHESDSNDFLMTVPRKQSSANVVNGDKFSGHFVAQGSNTTIKAVVHNFPKHIAVVGQTEPKIKVPMPASTALNQFKEKFAEFQIGRKLEFKAKTGAGLSRDEIQKKLFSNAVSGGIFTRQTLDKCLKRLGDLDSERGEYYLKDDYIGTQTLGNAFMPEQVCAFESYLSQLLRYADLGLSDKMVAVHVLPKIKASVQFFVANVTALKARLKEMKKRKRINAPPSSGVHVSEAKRKLYDNTAVAVAKFEKELEDEKRKLKITRFLCEELSIAPWNTTSDFIDIHRRKDLNVTSFMSLTGSGDPSGRGEAMSFLREAEATGMASKVAVDESKLADSRKKMVGKENDVRKLSQAELGSILRKSYGMSQQAVDTLKRWDRVHFIRELSTRATTEGVANDNLARYARGEKLKASEMRDVYDMRIQEIWRRQLFALGGDGQAKDKKEGDGVDDDADDDDVDEIAFDDEEEDFGDDGDGESDEGASDDDDDDDDVEDLAEDLLDQLGNNQGARATAAGGSEEATRGLFGAGAEKKKASIRDNLDDATQLEALRQEMKDRNAVGGLADGAGAGKKATKKIKVVKKMLVKTLPDGSQKISFEFNVDPNMARILELMNMKNEYRSTHPLEIPRDRPPPDESYAPGHQTFMDEVQDLEADSAIALRLGKNRTQTTSSKAGSKKRAALSMENLNERSKEAKIVYEDNYRPKGTNNRSSRGAASERKPHIMLGNRFEAIVDALMDFEFSAIFRRPVKKTQSFYAKYSELISKPIDLTTIKKRAGNPSYKYKTADMFLEELRLLHNNSVAFNGPNSEAARNSHTLFEFARNEIAENIDDFEELELKLLKEQHESRGKKRTQKEIEEEEEKMKQISLRRKERLASAEAAKAEAAMQAAAESAAAASAAAQSQNAGVAPAAESQLFTLDDDSDEDDDGDNADDV